MNFENLKKVEEHWRQEGLTLGKRLSEDEIIDAFANFGILFSSDVIEVYSTLNGFDEDEMDSECLSFWTLEKILKEIEPNSEYVYFADFLIDSHHYAFKFKDAEHSTVHVHYSEKERTKIADSFDEFFELYLNNPEKLFA